VYKLGLYWEFSKLYRGNDPSARNVVAAEIGQYADTLKLPVEIKTAMMGPSRNRGSFGDVMADAEEISKRVAEHWNSR
jgi:hypothetical protein